MKAKELADLLMRHPDAEVLYYNRYQDADGYYGETYVDTCTPSDVGFCEGNLYLYFKVLSTECVSNYYEEPTYVEDEETYDYDNDCECEYPEMPDDSYAIEESEHEDYVKLQEAYDFPKVSNIDWALERLILDIVGTDKETKKEINKLIDKPEDSKIYWEQAVEFLMSFAGLEGLTMALDMLGFLNYKSAPYYKLFEECLNQIRTLEDKLSELEY